MKAIREYLKVKDHKLIFELPENFDYDEVEIIILPRDKKTSFWSSSEIEKIGKIGFNSKSLDLDKEDYSKLRGGFNETK